MSLTRRTSLLGLSGSVLAVAATAAGLIIATPHATSTSATRATSATSRTPGSGTMLAADSAAFNPSSTSNAPAAPVAATTACATRGAYLTAIRAARQATADRVVFQFAGRLPSVSVTRVASVVGDGSGRPIPVAGQSFLRVTFHGASAICPATGHKTYLGSSSVTPYLQQVIDLEAAGDFEGVLSWGVGLARPSSYHAFTLTAPFRVVIDVSRPALPRFPGIWPVATWTGYWKSQYGWLHGHQPWLSSPPQVIRAWASSKGLQVRSLSQLAPGKYRVTERSGRHDTVTGTRPVSVPGPWVITSATIGR